jgi:hypothetical protein
VSGKNTETPENPINLKILNVTHHRQNSSNLRDFFTGRVIGAVIEVSSVLRTNRMDKSPTFSSQDAIRSISKMVSSTWNTKVMDEINKKFWEELIAYFSC